MAAVLLQSHSQRRAGRQEGALPCFVNLFLKSNGLLLFACISDQQKEDKKNYGLDDLIDLRVFNYCQKT